MEGPKINYHSCVTGKRSGRSAVLKGIRSQSREKGHIKRTRGEETRSGKPRGGIWFNRGTS